MSVVQDLLDNVLVFLKGQQMSSFVSNTVKTWYDKGLTSEEASYGMNFIRNEQRLDLLQSATENTIHDVTDDLQKRVRSIVEETRLQSGSLKDVRKGLKDLFTGKNLKVLDKTGKSRVVSWENRIKTIARTESNKVANMAKLDGVSQLPIKMRKYLSIVRDKRTTQVSKDGAKKYGSPEQSIPIEKNFKFTTTMNKQSVNIDKSAPPFWYNDRDSVMFISQREYEDIKGKKKE